VSAGPARGRLVAAVARYGGVGVACALLNVAILWLATERLRQPYPVGAAATCFITIPLSYFLHRWISFGIAAPPRWHEFARFVAAQLSQFALGFALLAAVVEGLGLRPWLAMVLVSGLMFAYGFVASSAWVFRLWRRPAPAPGGPLRVLQVSAFFPAHGGGIEVVAGELARRLARAGVAVAWMAGGPAGERADQEPGLVVDQAASVDFIERGLGLPAPIWSPGSLRRLWRRIGECDVVQVHDYLYFSSLAALCFAALRRRPVVLTQHICDIAFESRAARQVLRGLNRTLGRLVLGRVAQAVFVGRPVMACFEGFVRFRRPPLLVANGVDHALYHPDTARPARPPGAPLEVLFVGRFVEKKGLTLLRTSADLPGVRWTFVGRGPLSPAAWGLPPGALALPGVLPPASVADAMRDADVLVLPSKGEGFPLVLQEALACGTPVLTSSEVAAAFPRLDPACVLEVDIADPSEPGPAQRLRAAIESLARAPVRVRGARAAAATLAAQWSWEACVAAYLDVYRALAAGGVRDTN